MCFRYISLTHISSKHRFQISDESMKEFINKGFRIQNTKYKIKNTGYRAQDANTKN